MVHSFYSSAQPSGENTVVRNEVDALRRAGHDVGLFAALTDELEGETLYQLRTGLRVATGYGRNPLQAITDYAPDVVHVHNLFPNYGRKWVADVEQPLVHTLHNYRPLCANGMLYRDGHVCTLCPDGKRWAGMAYACYRGSRLRTLPLSLAGAGGAATDPLLRRADVLITLSTVQHRIYEGAGIDPSRMVLAANFLPADMDPGTPTAAPGDAWLFVGRLSPEKGIGELLERWPETETLRVVGDGPLLADAKARRGPRVEILGRRERSDVVALMGSSRGLIFPSRGFEGAPLVYMEALAAGLPVLSFPPTAVATTIESEGTGLVADRTDDLPTVLAHARETFPDLRAHCRRVFEAAYAEPSFIARRTRLYETVRAPTVSP